MYTYHAGMIWTAPAVDGREKSRFIRQCKDTKGWKCIFVLVMGLLVSY
jgi:hypothetical protein